MTTMYLSVVPSSTGAPQASGPREVSPRAVGPRPVTLRTAPARSSNRAVTP